MRVRPGEELAPRIAANSWVRKFLISLIIFKGTDMRDQNKEGKRIKTKKAEAQFRVSPRLEIGSNTEKRLFIS